MSAVASFLVQYFRRWILSLFKLLKKLSIGARIVQKLKRSLSRVELVDYAATRWQKRSIPPSRWTLSITLSVDDGRSSSPIISPRNVCRDRPAGFAGRLLHNCDGSGRLIGA